MADRAESAALGGSGSDETAAPQAGSGCGGSLVSHAAPTPLRTLPFSSEPLGAGRPRMRPARNRNLAQEDEKDLDLPF